MNAVAICGSRHIGGKTEGLLKHALEHLKKRGMAGSLIPMQWKKVFPCRQCGGCGTRQNGSCVIEGDDFAAFFTAMRKADVLLIGAPVDSGAAHPDFKHLLERAASVSRAGSRVFSRKIGAPVAVVATEVSRHSLQRLLAWFPAQDIVVPGAQGYANEYETAGIAVRAGATGEAVMESLAANLAWLAEKLITPPT